MKGNLLGFYNGGELRKFRPMTDLEIDGIHCSHEEYIELYPDGRLMCCRVTRDVREGDQQFPAGSRILKDENGHTHLYSFPIHEATVRLMNIEEDFSEPLLYAYRKRMEGKADSARDTFQPGQQDRNPMNHYESARIKRHCMIGGREESLNSYLYSANRTQRGDYNVITAFFHAESMLFVERNKQKLREDLRENNFYNPAINGFERVLEMKPDYHAARLHLVDIYSHIPEEQGGDREKAEMHAAELWKYDSVWAARADAILLAGEEGLLNFWRRIAASHGEDPLLQQELGRAYLSKGDVRQADSCFRKAMAHDPKKCTLLVDLARFHIKGLQRDQVRAPEHLAAAEQYLLEYIRTDPVNPHKAWCCAKLSWLKDLAGAADEGARLLEEAELLDMRFSREEAPPSLLLFIPLGEVYQEFESYFSL
jgi:tetratricopeptide (TPR) repeat protein